MAIKVLFVCLGNICRSPAAEAVFKNFVQNQGLESNFFIDSAATSGYHSGEKADERMRAHALKRGFKIESLARQLQSQDLDIFDHIIVMDDKNLRDVRALANDRHLTKIKKLTDFSSLGVQNVPDPYYGGAEGFERVLDIVEDACRGLLLQLQKHG